MFCFFLGIIIYSFCFLSILHKHQYLPLTNIDTMSPTLNSIFLPYWFGFNCFFYIST